MQVVVCGALKTPAPLKDTERPVSQAPANTKPVWPAAPLAGLVAVTTGAKVSRVTLEVAVVEFPALSVWVAVMALLPSPATKFTFALKVPPVQVGVAPAPVATPLPEMVTREPSPEQLPLTATLLA